MTTPDPAGSLVGVLVTSHFLVLVFGLMIGGAMGGRRDKKLRAKGIGHEHPLKRIAITAIEAGFGKDLTDAPKEWQNAVYGAVVDAEPDGPEAMAQAAKEMYRSLRAVRAAEDD